MVKQSVSSDDIALVDTEYVNSAMKVQARRIAGLPYKPDKKRKHKKGKCITPKRRSIR